MHLFVYTSSSALLVQPSTSWSTLDTKARLHARHAAPQALFGWKPAWKAALDAGDVMPASASAAATATSALLEAAETGTPIAVSPIGTPFSAQRPLAQIEKKWTGSTGTSFLPEEAISRAEDGNPIEKVKLAKDATTIFNSVYEYAAAIRSGETDWESIEKADFNTRLKWVGMVHRDKRTPGKFMMRMRIPNGIINADLLRFYADCIEPYGPELGVMDVTTRQNMQLRGVVLEDAT